MTDDTPVPHAHPTRRKLLQLAVLGGVIGAAYGGSALLRRLTEPDLTFEPISGLSGFRWVEGGPVSGGSTAMIGIRGADTGTKLSVRLSNSSVCKALFGPDPDRSRVQVAYFTDYRCVYCRSVSPMLAKLENEGRIAVTWHELPLLGQISSLAARAALAAREQGAYNIFHKRLMGAQAVPNPPYLRQLSDEAGIDGARLLRDMNSKEVLSQLSLSFAVAERFGFIGTPAMVIGRTAVMGGVDRRMAERLVAAERDAAQPAVC